jgi:FAD-linked oxidoreductase
MKNWAGSLNFEPEIILAPRSIEEIQKNVSSALDQKKSIRMIGSGHSWTKVFETNELLLNLDNYQGIHSVDKNEKIIHAKAGTKLFRFTNEAYELGFSLANQGDVEQQSLAGATSTGTHGTGISLQSFSNLIEEVTLVNGKAEVMKIGKDSEFFNAARLALGSLGVVSDLKIKMMDNYRLKVRTFPMPMNEALKHLEDWQLKHRHVELFYFPVGDWAIVKIMDETIEEPTPRTMIHKFKENFLENNVYEWFNQLAHSTGRYKFCDSIIQKFVSENTLIDNAHRAFPTERSVRFMEMEYNIPAHDFTRAFEKIRKKIKEKRFQTLFPIEIRFVKSDELMLSPASGRESAYIAFHTYIKESWNEYFFTMESMLKEFHGRPHWGKWHSMKAKDLEKLYPEFNQFCTIREKFDPHGCFLNDHLRELFIL